MSEITPAISYSGLKDLAISPLYYWHRHLNPNYCQEETEAMAFGKALHTAILEPDQFDARYYCAVDESDFPGCLDTVADMREWLKANCPEDPTKGTGDKAKTIAKILSIDGTAKILQLEQQRHEAANHGKIVISKTDWKRLAGCTNALLTQPTMKKLLATPGEREIRRAAVIDGVEWKGFFDFDSDDFILDVKTFTNSRGKSIERCIADAIRYERYHWQAFVYRTIKQAINPQFRGPVIFAFVESFEPHEVRFVALDRKDNVYWQAAANEINALAAQFSEYWDRFGEKPWRDEERVGDFTDEDMGVF